MRQGLFIETVAACLARQYRRGDLWLACGPTGAQDDTGTIAKMPDRRPAPSSAVPLPNRKCNYFHMRDSDYIFVVGCPRSGTTLLSVLLDRHSRLCISPETQFFDEALPLLTRDPKELMLDVLRRWSRLREFGIEPEAVMHLLGERDTAPADVLDAMLTLYRQSQQKPRCGEKTPQHLFHVPSLLELFPNAKVICIERDGREVALSLNAMPWWAPRNLSDAARLWNHAVEVAATFACDYPERFTIVRYEELVTHPERLLRPLMEFAGESFEPRQIEIDVPSGVVLARSLEWKGQALGEIQSAGIGRRSVQATAPERHFLEQALHHNLHRLGYLV